MPANQDVENQSVDLVVHAVIGHHADDFRGLSVAVDPPLALLVPGGVPGEVVVNDGVKVLLEVDPFAQAVGADQNAFRGFRQLQHAILALGGRQGARHRHDLDSLGQPAPQFLWRGTRPSG